MSPTRTEDKIISDYIKIRPSENDELIGQTYRCLCNKNEAEVIQRGWTADWKERIVFLDNDEVWDLQGFFLNWQSVDAVEVPANETPITATNTYCVSGTLERDESAGTIERLKHQQIYREVEAVNAAEAVDSFEVDGWEWIEAPTARLITEAMKMERGGQPSLFPLEEVRR